MKKREDFILQSKKIHGDKYDYSKIDYKKSTEKVCIICPEHGEFWQTPHNHLSGYGCPDCKKEKLREIKKDSFETFVCKAKKIHGDKYDYSKVEYVNSSTKVCIVCPEHGEFHITPGHFLQGVGCKKCGYEKNSKKRCFNNQKFIEKAKEIHGEKYDYSKVEYVNSSTKVCIVCPEHGEFHITPHDFLDGHGCPKCGNKVSNGESELMKYITEEIKVKAINRDRKTISPYEIDIYIPSKKVAIEYDGLIWHSEKFGKDKNYHLRKTKLCESKNIRLIHIFEDEWVYKKNIIKSMIANIFGKTPQRIFARKCTIKKIASKEAMTFLDENHIQGRCNAKFHYGLYFENNLVSIMSFGHTRQQRKYNKEYDNIYELLRFCNKLNTNVIGGASKLLKHFIKNINPQKIITYADKRWSVGNLYYTLGFTYTHDSKPNYYYVIGQKRENRFKYRKGQLVKAGYDKNKSERKIMLDRGIYRIYDCGTKVFVWINPEYKEKPLP